MNVDRNNPHYQIGFLWGALVVARSALTDARTNIEGRRPSRLCDDVDFAIRLATTALIETKAPVSA